MAQDAQGSGKSKEIDKRYKQQESLREGYGHEAGVSDITVHKYCLIRKIGNGAFGKLESLIYQVEFLRNQNNLSFKLLTKLYLGCVLEAYDVINSCKVAIKR